MKKCVILFFAICLYSFNGFAQRPQNSTEFGVFLGGAYYIGDLNPNGHFSEFTRPAAGLVYRYNFKRRYAIRGNFLYGNLEARDSESKSLYQQQRNLTFKTDLMELSCQFEFNYQNFEIGRDLSLIHI